MKILQISPIAFPLSRNMGYAGTERVILNLDEQFTRMGYESFVAAAKGSEVYGTLVEGPEAMWKTNASGFLEIVNTAGVYGDYFDYILEFALKERVDLIHIHYTRFLESEAFRNFRADIPILYTLHMPFENTLSDETQRRLEGILEEGRLIFFNAISKSQAGFFSKYIDIKGVIYHGIDTDLFKPSDGRDGSLFSLGKIARNKGQDTAIKVAKLSGRRLILGGGVHTPDKDFYEEKIRPILDGNVEVVGELTDKKKIPHFQRAAAFLMPIRWAEPFGLVMIEAMGCGTPVVAYNRGSVPEIVSDGETGFVIDPSGNEDNDLERMVAAVRRISEIDRRKVRDMVVSKFTTRHEAEEYIDLYKSITNSIPTESR